MTVLSCGILLFSFSFFPEMIEPASLPTNQGLICSRLELLSLEVFFFPFTEFILLLMELRLLSFWHLLSSTGIRLPLLTLLFTWLPTDESDLVTGWFEAKDVSCNFDATLLKKKHLGGFLITS